MRREIAGFDEVPALYDAVFLGAGHKHNHAEFFTVPIGEAFKKGVKKTYTHTNLTRSRQLENSRVDVSGIKLTFGRDLTKKEIDNFINGYGGLFIYEKLYPSFIPNYHLCKGVNFKEPLVLSKWDIESFHFQLNWDKPGFDPAKDVAVTLNFYGTLWRELF